MSDYFINTKSFIRLRAVIRGGARNGNEVGEFGIFLIMQWSQFFALMIIKKMRPRTVGSQIFRSYERERFIL